ncbi:cobalamin synthase [Stenotrophomonas panacihumi]|uniref:Adenosylcobinamide-GDP ribazoletransferase n=1 Tax=Stenotrophomonas panacihumi TaxID=676599 RepID=A0A0R0A6M2_9GAMM|nr:adenosylcobinamide-GDP ribazoletransferase [Stenotrophomonas panacihumi]KRG40742.1 cobalamin synthase [Stenotrophomonas panacihumi]PTN54819.1 adenosylcobinamide-GDP ribazoletransferase [Stenotrophomonas panacihumi]
MIDGLLVALGFLTRIPVPAGVFAREGAQARSLPWYPLVGLVVGIVLASLAWALQHSPPLLLAALVVAAWAWLTGGLHLDGLADTADAWIGGMGDRERTLAIMKDPRSGPAGVTALVLVLLLKFAAIASLPGPAQWPALVLAPLLGRAALTAAFLSTPYVRTGGMGAPLAGASRLACGLALLATLALVACVGRRAVIALLVVFAVFWLWRRACMRRLGGMTGDTCGALAEAVEVAVLVALAL